MACRIYPRLVSDTCTSLKLSKAVVRTVHFHTNVGDPRYGGRTRVLVPFRHAMVHIAVFLPLGTNSASNFVRAAGRRDLSLRPLVVRRVVRECPHRKMSSRIQTVTMRPALADGPVTLLVVSPATADGPTNRYPSGAQFEISS